MSSQKKKKKGVQTQEWVWYWHVTTGLFVESLKKAVKAVRQLRRDPNFKRNNKKEVLDKQEKRFIPNHIEAKLLIRINLTIFYL